MKTVIAEIKIDVKTHDPEKYDKVVSYRKRDLEKFIERHKEDIESVVCSSFDNLTFDIHVEEKEENK